MNRIIKKTIITALISLSTIIIATSGILGDNNNGTNNSEDLFNKYKHAGELQNGETYIYQETTIATIDGSKFSIENCENEINRYLCLNLAETREDAIKEIVLKELLRREAEALNIFVSDKKVDDLINQQREIIIKDPDTATMFKGYFTGLSLTEDEYWEIFYEDYRTFLTENELKTMLYDNYLEERIAERLDGLGISLSEQEFNELKEHEKEVGSPAIQEDFQKYYENYEGQLFSQYKVHIVKK